jgi:hypothetical protein
MHVKLTMVLCLVGFSAPTMIAVAQEQDDREAEADYAGQGQQASDGVLEPVDSGFLFIDGDYIVPPYRVTLSQDHQEVLVNDRAVPGAIPTRPGGARAGRSADDRSSDRGRRWAGSGSQHRGTRPTASPWAERLHEYLDLNAMIVAFSGEPIRFLGESQMYPLQKSLLAFDRGSEHYAEAMRIPRSPTAVPKWEQWLQSFQPSDAFRLRAEAFTSDMDVTEAENFSQAAAMRRLDRYAYPLTILGMLMSVIAFGHLLMSLPNNDAMRRGASESTGGISNEVIRATMISVVLVVALSSLDLIWTLLASQAGQMRELNPLASHFINDPLSLIAFKSTATLLGCGLLYALRSHSRAQMASWWMCLVCTMLTFRWLMFNSMFVT